MDKWLWMLSAMRIMTRGEGDCNVVKSRNGSIQGDFLAWKVKFLKRLQALAKGEKKSCSGNCKKGGSCKNKKKERQQEEEEKTDLQNSSEVRTDGFDHIIYTYIHFEKRPVPLTGDFKILEPNLLICSSVYCLTHSLAQPSEDQVQPTMAGSRQIHLFVHFLYALDIVVSKLE